MNELTTDIAIIGSGGAGLFAALRAAAHPADLEVTVVVKGMFGKSGCTRMVQGGYNAAFQPEDSPEIHLRDTIIGGGYLNDQHLAKALVEDAPRRVEEMEEVLGCRFDRTPEGGYDLKPFGGMTYDRTVHRRDLTGIEIVSRLADHVMTKPNVRILEEHRAIDLLVTRDGARVGGLVAADLRTGRFLVIRARTVLVATGGGARMYRYSSPSMEKSGDGVAMALRAGLELMDMEMLQFHPTGLLAGESVLTGSVVEEGLRGTGAYLLNTVGDRFMAPHDPERMERSTRDIVSRAIYLEVTEGRGTPQGGVYLDVSHIGVERVLTEFPGMVKRASLAGRDLTREAIEVIPTAHFHMGGVRIDPMGRTSIEGLFVAGEDAGGVHGCNRLGGNGVAESTIFGARGERQWLDSRPVGVFLRPCPQRLSRFVGGLSHYSASRVVPRIPMTFGGNSKRRCGRVQGWFVPGRVSTGRSGPCTLHEQGSFRSGLRGAVSTAWHGTKRWTWRTCWWLRKRYVTALLPGPRAGVLTTGPTIPTGMMRAGFVT